MRRILIDECINPRLSPRLRSALPNCSIETVEEMGWSGRKDHLLVAAIEGHFDVFVTIDKGFEFEHNLKKLKFGILVLSTLNNQMPSYERLIEELLREVESISPGQVIHVRDPER